MDNTTNTNYFVEITDTATKLYNLNFFVQYISSPKTYVHPHIHSAVEIIYFVKGTYKIFCNDTPYEASAGETVLFRSNAVHRIYPQTNGSVYYVLKINPSFVSDMSFSENEKRYMLHLSICNEGSKVIWTKEECVQNGLYDAWGRLIRNRLGQDALYDITLKAASADILIAILRDIIGTKEAFMEESQQTMIDKIYDAVKYINDHYSENITCENYSKSVFLSNGYFSRQFKAVTGVNFKHYLLLTRLDRAEKDLLCTDKPISEIALDCGFNNMSYFSAMYKRQKHITPTEARTKNRSNKNLNENDCTLTPENKI